jgi:NAD(P)H-nitrite reductase large subunit
MHYVIIGNGVAGVSAAEAIRSLDAEGAITMIGDETATPYCRPMISLVLEGAVSPEKLPIRPSSFYEDLDITPVLGERVSAIDVDEKILQVGDRSVSYDRLLIASGADPRPIKAEGLSLSNISYMRTEAHVRSMLSMVDGARKALVLGGGLVGFKAAYGLMRRGLEVSMLIRSGHPLYMQADPTTGKMVEEELVRKGLEVRVGVEVTAFSGKQKVEAAHLSDGTEMSCDMVVIGKGVLPALSFVPQDRIEIDLGIVIDRHMQTSAADVYAAGDVAEGVDAARRIRWVNAIWPEAVAQGRIAGFNMAGRPVAGRGSLGRNVIRIFDMDVMTGGLFSPPGDNGHEVLSVMDRRRGTYRKLVFDGDRLAGMVMVNDVEQGGVLLSLMHAQTPVKGPKEALLEPGFNFRKLVNY